MIDLSNTTLICIGSTKTQETLQAIEICCGFATFKDIKYFTDQDTPYTCRIAKIKSIREYDNFVIKELPKYIESDFALTIHWDGFIVNSNAWTNEFFNYDYIGAPWPWWNHVCGNGGFTLKSKKFLDAQKEMFNESYVVNSPDDVDLCINNRQTFIDKKCVYAPPNIAYQFSTEYGGYHNYNSFGFHDLRVNPQFKNKIYV